LSFSSTDFSEAVDSKDKVKGLPAPEIDVLIDAAVWIHQNGWRLQSISPPGGQGTKRGDQIQKIKERLLEAGVIFDNMEFTPGGPDIIARLDSSLWKIECKGLGGGKPQTLKNNFDRAVASTVSYYNKKDGLRLGLVMPKAEPYLGLIRRKIPQALREALSLWILLYNLDDKSVKAIKPEEPFPFGKPPIEPIEFPYEDED
jgi:hypothetical protein